MVTVARDVRGNSSHSNMIWSCQLVSEYHGKQLRVCQAQQELLNVPAPENGSLGRGFQDPPGVIQDE